MAHKLSDLNRALGKTGLDPKSIRETTRRLREARLIKTGVGGRYGGADMDARDAAVAVIALVGAGDSRDVINAARTVNLCSAMVIDRFSNPQETADIEAPSAAAFFGLPTQHTFAEAVEALVQSAACGFAPIDGTSALPLSIAVRRPWPRARITVLGQSEYEEWSFTAHYVHPEVINRSGFTEPKDFGSIANHRGDWLKSRDALFDGPSDYYEIERTMRREVFEVIGECLADEAPGFAIRRVAASWLRNNAVRDPPASEDADDNA
ncbi:MAG: hypothetical protein K0R27_3207 [Xanthobacteraceae bacterium]|jgi:hypothetical protein|nr:hypothetical protein [Xanthobacteraceae bacterium]